MNNASGLILYNGSSSLPSITHAYVTQMDLLLPTLTVRETLMYAASLQLSSNVTPAQHKQVVQEIILKLGLKECAETHVGNGVTHSGCSGGECQRVSIGIQLLSNPSVLFCDKPTTGLDATSAFHLVNMLKLLARKGWTIICTIHQPKYDIFWLFDHMLVLSKGLPLYSGVTMESTAWFEKLVPGSFGEHVNPADYLIMIAAVDMRTVQTRTGTTARSIELAKHWKAESAVRFSDEEKKVEVQDIQSPVSVAHGASFIRQTWVLTSRNLLMGWRDPLGMSMCWIEAVLMGTICGLIFFNLGKDLAGIRSRQGALYITSALQGYLVVLYETYRITNSEISVFDRKRGEGVISITPWILACRFAHIVQEDLVVPFLFSIIFWFTVFMFGTGYFVQADSIPVYLRWTKWISYTFYSFAALSANGFTGRSYECPVGNAHTNPNCLPYCGNFILRNLSFTIPTCALLGFIVVFSVAGGSLLYWKKVNVHMARVYTSKTVPDNDMDQLIPSNSVLEGEGTSTSKPHEGVDLDLQGIHLTL
ncbi:ATP-binding cassette transporter snq2 [Marasmius tenuissimus]|nr:ATP-binding cassette transporter snq2 [Marasmius tenuissimus]